MGVDICSYLGYGIMVSYDDFRSDNIIPLIEKYYDDSIDWNEASPDYVDELYEEMLYECDYTLNTDGYSYTRDQQWFVGSIIASDETEFSANRLLEVEREETDEVREVIKDFTGKNDEPRFCMFARWF